ncbi:MAG: hypothetical protein ACI8ZX_002199 [Planctomycetota bacterium]|jgi:hypothetical protein
MKTIFKILVIGVLLYAIYYAFIYFVPFSEGYRAGELIKISNKGVIFKTWEGEISQGVSEAQIFEFSVQDNEETAIALLKDMQGQQVKLTYIERYATFPWLGDTKYYVTKVEGTNKILGE